MEHCLSTRCRIHCQHSYEEGSLKQHIIVVLEAMNLVPSRRWESFWRSHRATQGSQGFLNLAAAKCHPVSRQMGCGAFFVKSPGSLELYQWFH